MKLMRIGARGAERPALLADDGTVLDLSGQAPYTAIGPNDSVLIPRSVATDWRRDR